MLRTDWSRACSSHPTWVRGLKPEAPDNSCRSSLSHPTWVRGLKLFACRSGKSPNTVAPYVGAWIETHLGVRLGIDAGVAPYVGAWIETQDVVFGGTQKKVAPYVGAWIETTYPIDFAHFLASHHTRVHGLKHSFFDYL